MPSSRINKSFVRIKENVDESLKKKERKKKKEGKKASSLTSLWINT